jgi:HNH endonuclease/NUMOD4 motif
VDAVMNENWLPIVGYEGQYEISDLGNVWSEKRNVILINHPKPPYGYLCVKLCKNGVKKSFRIHNLVLTAFEGPRPPGMVARHLNGIRDDNRYSNLKWGTPLENSEDKFQHGNDHNSNKTHCVRGHEFTPENTYINPSRYFRTCRQCVRDARGVKNPRKVAI